MLRLLLIMAALAAYVAKTPPEATLLSHHSFSFWCSTSRSIQGFGVDLDLDLDSWFRCGSTSRSPQGFGKMHWQKQFIVSIQLSRSGCRFGFGFGCRFGFGLWYVMMIGFGRCAASESFVKVVSRDLRRIAAVYASL